MAKDKSTTQRSSATITGIPVAGAIGGGDGSYKLGRPRRYPFYRDSGGSPSMSADSGFSSRLSTVNKGYTVDDREFSMFPEQEEEDEDTYNIDDYVLPFTRKLPRYSRVARRARGNSSVSEGDYKVKRPSLSQALLDDQNISELRVLPGGGSDWADAALDIGGDIVGDVGAALIGTVPVIGDFAAATFAGWNVKQLRDTLNKSQSDISAFLRSGGTDSGREALEDDLDNLIEDLIDFVQRSLEAIPDPGATELGSAGISILSNIGRLKFGKASWEAWRGLKNIKGAATGFQRASRELASAGASLPAGAASAARSGAKIGKWTGLGGRGIGASAKTSVILEPITKFIGDVAQGEAEDITGAPGSEPGSSGLAGIARDILTLGPVTAVPRRIMLLAHLIDDWDSQKAYWYDEGVPPEEFVSNGYYEPSVTLDPSNLDRYDPNVQPTARAVEPSAVAVAEEDDLPYGIFERKKILRKQDMSIKRLKYFIRESIELEAMKKESPYISSLGPGAIWEPNLAYSQCPHGSGPDCPMCDEKEIDYIKDFIVQVAGDEGIITSQQRLEEAKLREFIREAVKSQKKT